MEWSRRAPAPPEIEAGKRRLDEGLVVSQQVNARVAGVGIDIGRTRSTLLVRTAGEKLFCGRSGSAATLRPVRQYVTPSDRHGVLCGGRQVRRQLKELGHDARLMPAKYVRPYSTSQKNLFRDAEAIAEAVQRSLDHEPLDSVPDAGLMQGRVARLAI